MITGEFVFIVILTLVNIALWAFFYTKLKRTFSPHVLLSDIKNEVEKLIIEINRTTLDNVTLIEERTNSLKSLIDLADKRILLQEGQEKGKKREIEILNTLSSKNTPVATEQQAIQKYAKASKSYEESDHSDSVQLSIDFDSYKVDAPTEDVPISTVEPEMPKITNTQGTLLHEISLNEKVVQLAQNGLSTEEIAKQLACSITVVQLIIDLHLPNS